MVNVTVAPNAKTVSNSVAAPKAVITGPVEAPIVVSAPIAPPIVVTAPVAETVFV